MIRERINPASTQSARSVRRGRRHNELSIGDVRELALLESARALLREHPRSRPTVEAIAAGAGLTRTAFYFYFSRTEEIVARLGEDILEDVLEATAPFFDPTQPIETSIVEAVRGQIAVYADHGAVLCAIVELAGSDEEVRALWLGLMERFIDPIAARLEAYAREAGVEPDTRRLRHTAETLVWMLERYSYIWASGHYDYTADEVSEAITDSTLRLVRSVADRRREPRRLL